jgi:hypothetical protein
MHAQFKVFLRALLVAGLLASSALAEGDKPVKIFILAGQSNMVGSGQSDELPAEYQTPPDNVRVFSRQGKLVPLKPQGRFGPEVSFSHALAKAWPNETIVIVKVAVGGTSALAWSPTWSADKAKITQNEKQGALYDRLMTQVNALLKQEQGEVVAMLWAQGGRDARYEEAAKAYKANLNKIIDAVRRDLKKPKLPFLLAKTVDAPPARFPHIETVRAAQEEISKEVPFTKLISSERLAKHRDNIHFNTEGQIELGKRFAKAFVEADEKSTGTIKNN